MDPYAYKTAGVAIKALSNLAKAKIRIYGEELIPKGSIIFAVNHFTRMETLFIPYYINRLTGMTIWSLAASELFEGGLKKMLDRLGAISTTDPHRDRLIVRSLLTGEEAWVIFPEGRMVKSKKIYEKKGKAKGRYMVASPDGSHPPHTGTATLALRTEFYRERIRRMIEKNPEEATRLADLYKIEDAGSVLGRETFIVPVNLTYYPIRARENMLSRTAELFMKDLSGRMLEEIMTEGTMLLSGVDIDMRFGEPVRIARYLQSTAIQADIESTEPINFDDPIASREMMRKTAHKIMERYMSIIYRLTTVNHDHILATMLKYLQVKKIDAQDLKRRLYLFTQLSKQKNGIKWHESFSQNQISLLTDDRYQKFENFIDLAVQTGVIVREENNLLIQADFFESQDFHRVRLDHPIVVIANEIEPLTGIQEQLKDLARQPRLRIKYRVKQHLVNKALFEFEKDYANFAIPDESKDKTVGEPFLIKGGKRDIGIVLIHGYMAAPLEVRALAEYLGGLGYWIYVPRLKGHGTAPEDLATSTYMDWVESVEEGFAIINKICRKVVAGGFSTGAGLALDLCTRAKDVEGVFAISPPLKLQDISARFVPAVNLWNKLMGKLNVEAAKKEFVENHPENPHINYFRNPLSSIGELEKLMDQVEQKLPSLKLPALVLQSHGDPVVNPKGSLRIFERMGSSDKEYLMVNYMRHGIINGENSERVFKAVGDFVERLRQ